MYSRPRAPEVPATAFLARMKRWTEFELQFQSKHSRRPTKDEFEEHERNLPPTPSPKGSPADPEIMESPYFNQSGRGGF